MGRKEYPCDGFHGVCPWMGDNDTMTGNCRDNCGLGVDEDSDPADEYREVMICGE